MCWSLEASLGIAALGVGATAYAAYKKEPMPVLATVGFFSLMELLQAYNYLVVDACSEPANQVSALLAYLHIVFQPFFINAMSLYFIPPAVAKRVAPFAYTLCFVMAVVMLVQIYPFDWAGACTLDRPLCGARMCAVSGSWHIAWDIPINGIWDKLGWWPTYFLPGFLLPVLYGSWRMTLFHFLTGPAPAFLLTDNPNEWPAIWCLFSLGLILIALVTPIRRYLHVETWVWPKAWLSARA